MAPLLNALIQIVSLLANPFIVLIIVQFVIGLLFAFNVINTSNQSSARSIARSTCCSTRSCARCGG